MIQAQTSCSTATAVLVSLVAGCDAGDVGTPDDRVSGEPEFAAEAEMLGWIETIVDRGVRRPGYAANDQTAAWIARLFRDFGLQAVALNELSVSRWESSECALRIESASGTRELACFPLPFSAPTDGVEAELALDRWDQTRSASPLAGKIAVYANAHTEIPQSAVRDYAATSVYDPGGEFDSLVIESPFGSRMLGVMSPAQSAGAAGFVGVVGLSWPSNQYYVPYDDGAWELPGVWIDSVSGTALLQTMAEGPARGHISFRAQRTPATSHNVVGTLPGRRDSWVIIGSHHDGPWASAVEDASGVALVLAQAHYWSQVPEGQRPFHLMFVVNGGHMAGGAGIEALVADHAARIARSVVAIHLEHVARDFEVVNGTPSPLHAPTPRWWFTSEVAPLENAVQSALQDHDLRRSFVLPPATFSQRPPTDGALLYPQVPIVQLLAAPAYLFDPADTIEMVHGPSLVPITRAVVDIVRALDGHDHASLRALDRGPGELPVGPTVRACTPADQGACRNQADCAALEERDVTGVGIACALGCAEHAIPGICTVDCLGEHGGLTRPCMACYLAEVDCIYGPCLKECALGASSGRCLACRRQQGCFDALMACTGLESIP